MAQWLRPGRCVVVSEVCFEHWRGYARDELPQLWSPAFIDLRDDVSPSAMSMGDTVQQLTRTAARRLVELTGSAAAMCGWCNFRCVGVAVPGEVVEVEYIVMEVDGAAQWLLGHVEASTDRGDLIAIGAHAIDLIR